MGFSPTLTLRAFDAHATNQVVIYLSRPVISIDFTLILSVLRYMTLVIGLGLNMGPGLDMGG